MRLHGLSVAILVVVVLIKSTALAFPLIIEEKSNGHNIVANLDGRIILVIKIFVIIKKSALLFSIRIIRILHGTTNVFNVLAMIVLSSIKVISTLVIPQSKILYVYSYFHLG